MTMVDLPDELFPVDKTDPTTLPYKKGGQYPVEQTLATVAHLKTAARQRKWRYVGGAALARGIGGGGHLPYPDSAEGARAFFGIPAPAAVTHDGRGTWAVWSGNGEPDCPAFSEEDECGTPDVRNDVSVKTGLPAVSLPRPVRAAYEPAAEGVTAAALPRMALDENGRAFPIDVAGAAIRPPVKSAPPLTPSALHNLGLEVYRLSRKLPEPFAAQVLAVADELHARASKIELDALRARIEERGEKS